VSTFVLVPGAGGDPWYWHRVVPLLRQGGHEATAVDLPGDDPGAGLEEYAEVTAAAMAGRERIVLVAQSLGGFTVPMAAALSASVVEIVLVNAMVPSPGETPGEWWSATDAVPAREAAARAGGYSEQVNLGEYFMHDVPPAIGATLARRHRDESDAVFATPCRFTTWPVERTRIVSGAQDRFFPPLFQRKVARQRLGIVPDQLPGGHLLALSQPGALATYLMK
jgi:hypothetical protein